MLGRFTLLALAVSAAVSGATVSAAPGSTLASGRIVFSTVDGMASLNPDGSGAWGLRYTRIGQAAPAWKRDGSVLALSQLDAGGRSIVLMDPDGTNVRPLTHTSFATNPSWSPDGERIAFDDGSTVYSIAADGSGLTRIAAGTEPAWSPDGRRIVFTSPTADEGGLDLFSVELATGVFHRLTNTPGSDTAPAFSPDGRLAFDSDRSGAAELWLMDGDGSKQRALGPGGAFGLDPAWSPDGTRIAFSRDGQIWTIRADGSDARELTANAGGAQGPAWQPLPPAPPGCTLWGTEANDLLVGTGGRDVICGLGGDDSLIGLRGGDDLDGGPGNDWLAGGPGYDLLSGGDGDDLLDARDGGGDVLAGSGGFDRALVDAGRELGSADRRIVSRNVAAWRPTTASHDEPTNPSVLAVDGRLDDYWSSGGYPPQWLEVDLLRPTTIARLRLVAPDLPTDASVLVLARSADGSYRLLHRFRGPAVFEQALTFRPRHPWHGVRWLRLQVPAGGTSGWVAWPELEAYDV